MFCLHTSLEELYYLFLCFEGFPVPKTWLQVETGKDYDRYVVPENSPEYLAVVQNIKERDGEEFVNKVYQVSEICLQPQNKVL
jgi:hypothetical protein